MQIVLDEDTLFLYPDHSVIYVGLTDRISKDNRWITLIETVEPLPRIRPTDTAERYFIVEQEMYALFYWRISLRDVVQHLEIINELLEGGRMRALQCEPHVLGGAAITALFLGLDDFIVQQVMYVRRLEYRRMHIDIGLPTIYLKDHDVMAYVGNCLTSDHTLTEFNGTFLPYGYGQSRGKCVKLRDSVECMVRILYEHLCLRKEYQDYLWKLNVPPEEIVILHKYCHDSNAPLPKVETLKYLIPSMSILNSEDVKYLCTVYGEKRKLYEYYPEVRNLLIELGYKPKIKSGGVGVELVPDIANTCDSALLLEMILQAGLYEYLPRVIPDPNVVHVLERYYHVLDSYGRSHIDRWQASL